MTTWQTITRGIEEIIPKESAETLSSGEKKLTIKFGADPSAPDLHLGHMVILKKLRQFQDLGHKVLFLIGDFTAMIGDPTGKSETRKPLDREAIAKNAETYIAQVFKVLNPEQTTIVYNSEWLDKLSAVDLIQLAGKYTVARMLERDDFEKRYKGNQSISVHEFLYPLLQGYDSVHLKSQVEIGGTDQKFNLLMGRHLQREYASGLEQIIITCPILEGTDGVQKMSKSLNNYIGILESPKEQFGKLMSIPDQVMNKYFALLTDYSDKDLLKMSSEMKAGENPRTYKIRLAKAIISQLHSEDAAEYEAAEFERIFSQKGIPSEMPECVLEAGKPIQIVNFALEKGWIESKKEMGRLIQQGAVTIDGEKVMGHDAMFTPVNQHVLKIGKRKFYRLVAEGSTL